MTDYGFTRAQADYEARTPHESDICYFCDEATGDYDYDGCLCCEACYAEHEAQTAEHEAMFIAGWNFIHGVLCLEFDLQTAFKHADLITIDYSNAVAYVECDWHDLLDAQAQAVASGTALGLRYE